MHNRLVPPRQGDGFDGIREMICWIIAGRQIRARPFPSPPLHPQIKQLRERRVAVRHSKVCVAHPHLNVGEYRVAVPLILGVPIRMRGPLMTGEALRNRPLTEAAGANAAGIERIPGLSAATHPIIISAG